MIDVDLDLELWPRQMEAFQSEATELLFGGATEGGKSHFVRVALIVWCLAIEGLQCCLIRKKSKDILKNHVQGPTGFAALLAPLIALKQVTITQEEIRFPNGSVISFQHCQDERQFDSAQGVEKHVLVIDEATQISERLVRFFRAWVRMPTEMRARLPKEFKDKFPCIIYTANPIGASLGYFRREFVKARKPFEIAEIDGFKRQYIPSRYVDNGSVDAEAHKGRLAGLGDAALARALDEGDWDAPLGDFFREYDESRHVIFDIELPAYWFKFRSFDWGSAEPFACYWIAVSDGEPFDYKGTNYWFPRGALIIYREWYGCNPLKPAEGLRVTNEQIAKGIVARTHETTSNYTVTDSFPFQDRGGWTIAMEFQKHGCPLTLGDTSRVSGWSQLRSRLIGREFENGIFEPMIYIMASCKYAREYLPAIERHPTKAEDAVENGEATHSCDALRISCTTFPIVKDATPAPVASTYERANMITPAKILLKKKKAVSRVGQR